MRVEVKFCGLTRTEDARTAAAVGARYVGVIFAGGPRRVENADRARTILDGAGSGVERVGVFGRTAAEAIARIASEARLDIVQLHDSPTIAEIQAVRAATGARVWAVVRVEVAEHDALSTDALNGVRDAADALVLDSRVGAALGGTGMTFDWAAAAPAVRERSAQLVVAGGLTPGNVQMAIETLSPDVVDVSSGVESSPGIKDHGRMTDFMNAVRRAAVLR